jgi:hypothetical protein
MTDIAWNELSSLTDTLERLHHELERCVEGEAHRHRLESEIRRLGARRAQLIESLCHAVPAQVAAPRT